MRASVADRRLEAIAGTPLHDVNSPQEIMLSEGMYVFVAGRIADNYNNRYLFDARPTISHYSYSVNATSRIALYGIDDVRINGIIGATGDQQIGDLVVISYRAKRTGGVHVGQRYSENERWAGPIRAITYDHALDRAQVEALILSLSLSLRLT